MRGVNKIALMGNLGADPEIRHTQSGVAVANIRLATNFQWKDKTTGEKRDHTEWHRVVIFGKLAEIADKYLSKGDPVYFEGRNQTRKWQGQDGQDRYTTEVVVSEMNLIGGNGSSTSPTESASKAAAETAPATTGEDFDDDIPF